MGNRARRGMVYGSGLEKCYVANFIRIRTRKCLAKNTAPEGYFSLQHLYQQVLGTTLQSKAGQRPLWIDGIVETTSSSNVGKIWTKKKNASKK